MVCQTVFEKLLKDVKKGHGVFLPMGSLSANTQA